MRGCVNRRFFGAIALSLLCVFASAAHAAQADNARQRGWGAFDKRDYQAAAKAFDEALELEPDSVDALVGRARTKGNLEKPAEAMADARRAIELAPDNAEGNHQ